VLDVLASELDMLDGEQGERGLDMLDSEQSEQGRISFSI